MTRYGRGILCAPLAPEIADRLDLEPMAFFRGWAVAGCEPATMGIGPVPAVAKLTELVLTHCPQRAVGFHEHAVPLSCRNLRNTCANLNG